MLHRRTRTAWLPLLLVTLLCLTLSGTPIGGGDDLVRIDVGEGAPSVEARDRAIGSDEVGDAMARPGVTVPSGEGVRPVLPVPAVAAPPEETLESPAILPPAAQPRTPVPLVVHAHDGHDATGDGLSLEAATPSPAPLPVARWSDPATWPLGRVPGATDDVTIAGHVLVDGPVRVRSVNVPAGSVLEFLPEQSAALEMAGNLVVAGVLRMRPASTAVEHLIRFVGVDERRYVGGGHEVRASDVGLWVVEDGRADLVGSSRRPWSRATGSLRSGDRSLDLVDDPSGWQVGDEIAIPPTSPPGTEGFADGYSYARVSSVVGSTITLDTPLAFDHPQVAGRWTAEVLNLTRNVRIEGTPDGRAHVHFNHTKAAQLLRHVQLRHLGPRQETDETYLREGSRVPITAGVLGRYPLHFHHNGSGSEGSMVEGVVVRESGHRAFVAHASNGITFRGTIAHDVMQTPYWWDRRDGCCGRHARWQPPSHRITYERAVASLVSDDPPFRGTRLAGFELGHGNDLVVRDSVAVGVQGSRHAAGFNWPEGVAAESGNAGVGDHWTFHGNVAHNNAMNGLFGWQNTGAPGHLIERSVAYHNGSDGIVHGAYKNAYVYQDLDLHGNGRSGIELHAQGALQFRNVRIDGAGRSAFGLVTSRHRATTPGALLMEPRFSGYTVRAVAFASPDTVHLDVVRPEFAGGQGTWFHLSDEVPADSVIRIQLTDGSAFRLHPLRATVGVPIPEWNARREPIPPFAP
jgi:hypothetical protein